MGWDIVCRRVSSYWWLANYVFTKFYTAHFSGERSHFANKMKALNRLKAKLLMLAMEQGVTDIDKIKSGSSTTLWKHEARRYMFRPHKLVQDVRTGVHLPDLNSVLNGNIEPLIRAHITLRQQARDAAI